MKVLVICLSLFVTTPSPHEFHVSIFEVNYNMEAEMLEVSAKLFLDDFENALEKRFRIDLEFGVDEEVEMLDSLIGIYFDERFQAIRDSKIVQLELLGHEYEADVIWCYLEGTVENYNRFEIKNTMLFELFDDQSHLLHYSKGKDAQSIILNKNNPQEILTF